MKRSVFFWPVVSGVGVLVLWLALCLFMTGIPVGPASLRNFSVPARRLLGESHSLWYRRSTWHFEGVVDGLWQLAPYCFPSGVVPDSWRKLEPPPGIQLPRAGGQVSIGRLARRGPFAREYDDKQIPLSHAQVLLYVFVLPGFHFAGAAFAVGLLVVGVRMLAGRLVPKAPADEGDEG